MGFHARALKLNPREVKSLVGIANCMFEMKNIDQAII